MKKKYALISVYNKNGLNKICKNLFKHNINIISTGSTATQINKMGFDCKFVSDSVLSISVEMVSANAEGIIIVTISAATYANFSFKPKLRL